MPNMSYCRFQNTVKDLEDCFNHMDQEDSMSASERDARKNLIHRCAEIVDNYGKEEGFILDAVDEG
jgi:hypothetical protein